MNIKQIIIRLLLGAGISLAMLSFLLFTFSSAGESINLSKLIDLIRNVAPAGLLWYLLTQLIGVGLRSLRYRDLLLISGDETKPGLKDLIPVTLIRNMTVDLLPARVGELVFVGLLKKTNNTQASHSLTCLLFATLFDIAIILPVVIILAIFILTENQTRLTLLSGAGLILFCLICLYFGLKYLAPRLTSLIARVSTKFNNQLIKKLADFIENLNTAIQSTIKGGNTYRVIGYTIALRVTKYLGLCLLFISVVDSSYPHLAQIPASQLVSILIAGETAASLPIPTFLSLGSYEAGAAGMLSLFGVGLGTGVLIMLAVHLCSQIIDYTIGLAAVGWLLFRSHVKRQSNKNYNLSRKSTALIVLTLALGLAALFTSWQAIRTAWSINAPPAGRPAEDANLEESLTKWDGGRGFIVFSSNRNGNHDIYHLRLPQGQLTQITDHPHTENLPKISPDGRKLVFQRGRKTWHSFRDPTPWDIILKDLKTGQERILAENGSDPNWAPDGKHATFRRDNSNMYSVNIKSGEEKLLFTAKHLNLPENAGLQTPMVNSLGELAVTIRGPLRMTAVYKINNPIHVGQGCQVTWSPDERFVYYIDHGGKGQNLLRRYDFETGENKIWMDIPGPYSHEYFPKLTQDGKWLVFAASTGGHEHDTADYELFLWKVDSDPNTAIRLTHHSGNDSWPDIYVF